MKFTIQREKDEEIKLRLEEHDGGVTVVEVGSGCAIIELYNDGELHVKSRGATLFGCGTGKVTK